MNVDKKRKVIKEEVILVRRGAKSEGQRVDEEC